MYVKSVSTNLVNRLLEVRLLLSSLFTIATSSLALVMSERDWPNQRREDDTILTEHTPGTPIFLVSLFFVFFFLVQRRNVASDIGKDSIEGKIERWYEDRMNTNLSRINIILLTRHRLLEASSPFALRSPSLKEDHKFALKKVCLTWCNISVTSHTFLFHLALPVAATLAQIGQDLCEFVDDDVVCWQSCRGLKEFNWFTRNNTAISFDGRTI